MSSLLFCGRVLIQKTQKTVVIHHQKCVCVYLSHLCISSSFAFVFLVTVTKNLIFCLQASNTNRCKLSIYVSTVLVAKEANLKHITIYDHLKAEVHVDNLTTSSVSSSALAISAAQDEGTSNTYISVARNDVSNVLLVKNLLSCNNNAIDRNFQ